MGAPTVKLPPIPTAPPAPDLTDDAVLQARRAQARALLTRRGLQSTQTGGPAPVMPSTLVGTY